METDAVIATCKGLSWIDMSMILDREEQREATAAELKRPDRIEDLIDDASLSTFHPSKKPQGSRSSMKQGRNDDTTMLPPTEVVTDQSSVAGQSVGTATSSIS